MNQRKKNIRIRIRVGVFVLLGTVSLFAYILLLGDNQTFFNLTSKYKVKFQKVDGLFAGSVVTVNGVPAGNVSSIHFMYETGDIQVVLSILRKFSPVITDQSTAALVTKGVLGDKYVAITTTGNKGAKLPKGSYIPAQSAVGLLGFSPNKGMGDKISTILEELLVVIQSINSEGTIKKVGQSMKSVHSMFSKDKSKDLSEILKRLNSILTKVDEGEGTLGALINNKNLYNRVLSLLGQSPYHKYLPSLVDKKKKVSK